MIGTLAARVSLPIHPPKAAPHDWQTTGILSDKNPPQVIVDCNGVGYEVQVPMSTFFSTCPPTAPRSAC